MRGALWAQARHAACAHESTFQTQLLLAFEVQVTIRLEHRRPFMCCWGGAAAPARRQRCTRHPGLFTTRRIRHGACERREVGVSSPAQRATMGCTAGSTITHIFRGRHWRNPQHRGRGHSTTWALSLRGHSRHAHLLGTSAREAALSWLVGGVPTPPATWLAAAELQMTAWSASARRRRRLLGAGRGSESRGWRRVARSRGPFGGRGRCGIATVASCERDCTPSTAGGMVVRGSPQERSSHIKQPHVTRERRKQQPKPSSSERDRTPATAVEVEARGSPR